MYQSDDISQLEQALLEMHKEFGVIIGKDAKSHTNRYASLGAILDQLQPQLFKHGLVMHRGPLVIDGKQAVFTRLSHPSSKQWVCVQSLLSPQENHRSADQAWGGSTTYHYRYDAMAICGVFADGDIADTDGNYEEAPANAAINEKQYWLLNSKLGSNNELREKILSHYKITDLKYLPKDKMNELMERLDKKG